MTNKYIQQIENALAKISNGIDINKLSKKINYIKNKYDIDEDTSYYTQLRIFNFLYDLQQNDSERRRDIINQMRLISGYFSQDLNDYIEHIENDCLPNVTYENGEWTFVETDRYFDSEGFIGTVWDYLRSTVSDKKLWEFNRFLHFDI